MHSKELVKVAAIQMQGKPCEFVHNIRVAREMAEEAFQRGAKIVALPEFFASPVILELPFRSCALDAQDNPALAMMRELAMKHRGCIGGSVVLRSADGIFNSYLLVQPDGRHHLHNKDRATMWENCHYEGGRDDGFMSTPLGGVGAAVCWEMIRSRTVARLRGRIGLAMTGNHWWTVPSNWPLLTSLLRPLGRANRQISDQMPRQFARLLGVPVLHASHCGGFRSRFLLAPGSTASVAYDTEFVGASQIVDGRGEVVAARSTREGPGIVEGSITLGAVEPTATLEQDRYWIPRLPLLHRAYWHHQNLCGQWFYRRHVAAAAAPASLHPTV